MRTIDIGDTVWLKASFEDYNGAPADPTTVTFMIKLPDDGAETQYVYNVDPEVEKTAVGEYRFEFTAGETTGIWSYRYVGVGVVSQAGEEDFKVRTSKFSNPL